MVKDDSAPTLFGLPVITSDSMIGAPELRLGPRRIPLNCVWDEERGLFVMTPKDEDEALPGRQD